ncbi:hypothetical protein, partial [Lentimonas sp. CC4]|uniref:hypothetical protein n=1 Tax=Lentimonas sp. CC4 TaxID=2676099 RepID=UPI001A7E3B87
SCCRGFACEARAKATRIGSCKTLAAFAGAALRQALGLEPVETASSTPTPDASILQITILDAREYIRLWRLAEWHAGVIHSYL